MTGTRTGPTPAARPARRVAARAPVARPSAPRAHRLRTVGPTRPVRQRGVALVVALVLLIATSVLAISTLSGTRMSEMMASNAQHKAIAFEAADSGLEAAWGDRDLLLDALASVPGDDPTWKQLESLRIELDDAYDQPGSGLDLVGDRLSVQYCGESVSINGSDMGMDESLDGATGSLVFDVEAIVRAEGAGTRAEHVQRGTVSGPMVGRTGACTAP